MKRSCLAMFLIALIAVGCRSAVRHKGNEAYYDTSQLYRCIDLIESRQIRRGMSTNDLKTVFQESLGFRGEEEAFALLSEPRHHYEKPVQSGPLWIIIFTIKNGLVVDYSITLGGDK
jgi:hypothetical protein